MAVKRSLVFNFRPIARKTSVSESCGYRRISGSTFSVFHSDTIIIGIAPKALIISFIYLFFFFIRFQLLSSLFSFCLNAHRVDFSFFTQYFFRIFILFGNFPLQTPSVVPK